MEIKTNGITRETDFGEPPPSSDRGRYLRRTAHQKLRRSYSGSRLLVAALKVAGRIGVLVLTAGFLVSVFLFAYTSDRFALRTVTFYGCNQLDPARLEQVIRQEFPPNILRIELSKLQHRLEQETWARRVEIRRMLPSDLAIYIQERTPSVILELHGELVLTDEEGILLDKYDSKYGKLDVPVFKGVLGDSAESYRMYQEENSDRVKAGLKMLAELDGGSRAFTRSISEVDLSEKNNLKVLLLDDTVEVYLGNKDFFKRFQALMSNLAQYRNLKSQYSDIASVDLRFDGQIIYRPRQAVGGETAETPEARP